MEKGIKKWAGLALVFFLCFFLGSQSLAQAEEGRQDGKVSKSYRGTELAKEKEERNNELSSLIQNKSMKTRQAPSAREGNHKTFTVTKRPVDDPSAEEEPVGEYDTFDDAIRACTQEDLGNQYIVTMNGDYEMPESEGGWFTQEVNILLRSAEGKQFTLKRTGTNKSLGSIYQNCNYKVENIILDGNNEGEAFSIMKNGTLTLGKGAILQNFSNNSNIIFGPAIHITGQGTLNIFDGAIIKDNKSDLDEAGVIQLNEPDTTLNIYGGEFIGNKASVDGGVFLSWGTINISGGTFKENSAKGYGGVIASFGGELNITGGTFTNNSAGEEGGAIVFGSDGDKLSISNAKFYENQAEKQGGGVSVLIDPDAEKETPDAEISINNSVFHRNVSGSGGALSISLPTTINKCNFVENEAVLRDGGDKENPYDSGMGGAIYVAPYQYETEITDPEAYKNLKTDETTFFQGNKSGEGLFNPPINFETLTDLKFDEKSDVQHGVLTRKSLLNNYDVNYKNDKRLIIYDANGGKFADGKDIKVEEYPVGKEIQIANAPTREGYTFDYWKGSQYQPGDKYTVTENHEFIAQWKENPGKPDEKPDEKPDGKPNKKPGRPSGKLPQDALNRQDHYQYLIGYPDGSFKPKQEMTRLEVAIMFTRLLNDQPLKGQAYPVNFKDVSEKDWYTDIVGYALHKGIIMGYPDGNFKANKPITREEFAAIAARFGQLTEEKDLEFTDMTADRWSYKDVRLAVSNGWILGYPDKTFRPEQNITRAEVTSITNRMLNRFGDVKWIEAHPDQVGRFTDVLPKDWYFEAVMEAGRGHDFERDKDGRTEHWTGLNNKSFVW